MVQRNWKGTVIVHRESPWGPHPSSHYGDFEMPSRGGWAGSKWCLNSCSVHHKKKGYKVFFWVKWFYWSVAEHLVVTKPWLKVFVGLCPTFLKYRNRSLNNLCLWRSGVGWVSSFNQPDGKVVRRISIVLTFLGDVSGKVGMICTTGVKRHW